MARNTMQALHINVPDLRYQCVSIDYSRGCGYSGSVTSGVFCGALAAAQSQGKRAGVAEFTRCGSARLEMFPGNEYQQETKSTDQFLACSARDGTTAGVGAAE